MFAASALIAGDDFFAFLDQGSVPPWTAAAHEQNETVIEAAAAAAGRLSASGYTVVYDGFLGPGFLPRFRTATGLRTLHYAVLLPPQQLCLDRVGSRAGHGFTDQPAARRMYRELAEANIAPNYVIPSSADPARIAATIVKLVNTGAITTAGDATAGPPG